MSLLLIKLAMLAGILTPLSAYAAPDGCDNETRFYAFSWAIADGCDNAPRGGSSVGAEVVLQTSAHTGWLRIHEAGLTKFEQDRAAILGMAGGYKVEFDFLETVGFEEDYQRDKPYQSWGTEYVYVLTDEPKFISLQHVMVMYFKQEDGSISEPMVMKHWRQDWTYQDQRLLEYQFDNKWAVRELPEQEVAGKWSQAVFQVDDSPRYESIGEWQHNASFSSWKSATTRRPLPRREYSVRDDYHLLEGFNRHTVTRYGWVQEEENWKMVVDDNGARDSVQPYLAKELGVARYQLTENVDFTPGDEYMEKSGPFWSAVRAVWAEHFADNESLLLSKTYDGMPLFMPLFQGASESEPVDGKASEQDLELIRTTISNYLKQQSEAG